MFLVIWKSACFFCLHSYWVVNVWCCSEKRLEHFFMQQTVSCDCWGSRSSCGRLAVNAPRPVSVCTAHRFRFSLNIHWAEFLDTHFSDDPRSLLSVLPCFNCKTQTTFVCLIKCCDMDCESCDRPNLCMHIVCNTHTHRSVTTLKPLTVQMNPTSHLTMVQYSAGNSLLVIQGNSNTPVQMTTPPAGWEQLRNSPRKSSDPSLECCRHEGHCSICLGGLKGQNIHMRTRTPGVPLHDDMVFSLLLNKSIWFHSLIFNLILYDKTLLETFTTLQSL